jgi:hypothetical protein
VHRLVLGGGAGGFSRHKYFPKISKNGRQPDERNTFYLIRLSVNQYLWVGLKKVGTRVLVKRTDFTYIL